MLPQITKMSTEAQETSGLIPIEALNPSEILLMLHNWKEVVLVDAKAWQFVPNVEFDAQLTKVLTIGKPTRIMGDIDPNKYGVWYKNKLKLWESHNRGVYVGENASEIYSGNMVVRNLRGYELNREAGTLTLTNGIDRMVLTGREHSVEVFEGGKLMGVDHVCDLFER